jgi:cytochrome oxidase Cu insertion factor (SCO1/SenC/PrrC family)
MIAFAWLMLAASLLARQTASRPPSHPDAATVVVGPGTYRPLYPASPADREIPVGPFRLDRVPVTNEKFLAFVLAHPEWRRDGVAPQLVDERYLARWGSPDALGPDVDPRQPVVEVSWFAARAYCGAQGMRLPTRAEWEVAAAASKTQVDASADAAWKAHLLELYTRPSPARLPRVGQTEPNRWGVRDLHGVVWEWVSDFDASPGSDDEALRFCAGGAQPAGDKTDFAAFEREAMRSALRAAYTTENLGFRCAAALEPTAPESGSVYDLHTALRDQDGHAVPVDVYRGHPLLISMFYGSCPSACPLLVSNIARLDAELPAPVRADTRVLLVSFDSEHDTPEALREVAARHRLDSSRWTLASAPEDDAARLAARLGITYRKLPGGGFAHTSVIVALDRDGRTIARAEGPDADLAPMVDAIAHASR